jgi:hypothetical protein
MQHPQVMYLPDVPGYGKAEYEAEHFLVPAGVGDPTQGLFSTTLGSKGATLNRTMLEAITDIIAARRPLGDFDQVVKDRVENGGEQIRKELVEALAAASR